MDLAHEPPLQLGGLLVRPSTREVVHAGGRDVLEPRVMEVLVTLAKAGGQVVSRDDLIAACWDRRIVSEDAINRVISRIRRLAVSTGERDFKLETITKVGYRLVAAPARDKAAASTKPLGSAASVAPSAILQFLADRRRLASAAAALLALAVTAGLIAARLAPRAEPAAPATALTLAVLPFDSLSDASETGFLAESLSRELRNSLSRVRGLRVISDSSSFAAAAEPIGAVEIGDRLGADLLLDGSVRHAEGALRVTLELVDADSGAQTWSTARTIDADDLAEGEQTLTGAVIEELIARLGPDRIEAFAPPRTPDPDSYRLVLEARAMANEAATFRQQGRLEEFYARAQEAEDMALRAVEIDPENADALVLAGRIGTRQIGNIPANANLLGGRQAEILDLLNRALAVDADNPAALTALGERLRTYEWRWLDAERMHARAIAIDPNYPDAHTSNAYLMATMGRCLEGLESARAAARLDPEFIWRRFAEPRLLKCAGRRDEAARLYLELLDSDREQVFLASEIHINHITDRNGAALRSAAAHIRDELWAGETMPPVMAAAVARMEAGADALEGDTDAYRAVLDADRATLQNYYENGRVVTETGRTSTDRLWMLAIEYAAIGETERAIDLLEEAIAGGSLYIPETMPHGAYEFTPEVRANPRYQALWRRDPRLVELVEIRRQSVENRQMEGVLPNGRRVRPKTP